MKVHIIFKSGERRPRKPIQFEGRIVYTDGKTITTEIADNGARQYWDIEKDNIFSVECY